MLWTLHTTCKYIYLKKPYTLVDKLTVYHFDENEVNDEHKAFFKNKFDYYSVHIFERDLHLLKDKLYIDGRLIIVRPQPCNVISKIWHCDLYYLEICSENLTMEDLKFLTKPGNVTTFLLSYKVYYCDKNTFVPPEELLSLVPKANFIRWDI